MAAMGRSRLENSIRCQRWKLPLCIDYWCLFFLWKWNVWCESIWTLCGWLASNLSVSEPGILSTERVALVHPDTIMSDTLKSYGKFPKVNHLSMDLNDDISRSIQKTVVLNPMLFIQSGYSSLKYLFCSLALADESYLKMELEHDRRSDNADVSIF